ncbi:UNVERIFIED_ORG: hypothetical protein [Escherichia phage CMSTMSU]
MGYAITKHGYIYTAANGYFQIHHDLSVAIGILWEMEDIGGYERTKFPNLQNDPELHEEHDIIVDVEKKEVVMKKQAYRILDNFYLKAFIMKFCADEHLTGRVIRKES